MEKGSYVWVLKNYSLQKQKNLGIDKAIESEEFTAAGHRWTLLLYPLGRNLDVYDDGYTSIYLCLKSKTSEYDPVRCVYEIFLLNQSDAYGCVPGISLFLQKTAVPCLQHGDLTGGLRFLERAEVESPDHLKDDCLKIRCTIGVLVSRISEGMDFRDLLESGDGADVFFRVENQTVYAHKGIVAARFPAYSRLIRLHCKVPQQFVIKDMEIRIFKAVLWFIYTGNLPEEELKAVNDSSSDVLIEFMGKMHAAADRFNLIKLKKICESHILERLLGETDKNREALLGSDSCPHLKKIFPSLFTSSVCCEETPSTSGQGKFDLCSKILSVTKEALVGVYENPIKMKHKIKED